MQSTTCIVLLLHDYLMLSCVRAGSVYIYTCDLSGLTNTYSYVTTLYPTSDGSTNFGYSIDINSDGNSDVAVIGAGGISGGCREIYR